MRPFKVGDIVVGNSKSDRYGITNRENGYGEVIDATSPGTIEVVWRGRIGNGNNFVVDASCFTLKTRRWKDEIKS